MHTNGKLRKQWILFLAALFVMCSGSSALAVIQGVDGPDFSFTAKSGYISTADGSSVYFWGLADNNGSGTVQYPGPTMIVNAGDTVTVTLTNELQEPTSLLFPGHEVTADGGVPGLLTREAPPDRLTSVTYTFTAGEPGTYTYYSGTESDLQIEMGLVGAIIVRPTAASGASVIYDETDPATFTGYGDSRSAYDHEYLFLMTEMDPVIHDLIENGRRDEVDTTTFLPVLWFINGRNAPDTMAANCDKTLPAQPYNVMPRLTPGDRLLMRLIGGGRDLHPFHTHGNNFELVARDGRLLESSAGASRSAEKGTIPDLSVSDFTQTVAPGATYDAIFTWTGRELGWDYYGHSLSDDAVTDTENSPKTDAAAGEIYAQTTLNGAHLAGDLAFTVTDDTGFPRNHAFRAVVSAATDRFLDEDGATREVVLMTRTAANTFTVTRAREGTVAPGWADGSHVSLTDHGADFPVLLPGTNELTFGATYSGSPFLGNAGFLPPAEGGNNANSGFFYMWHSHNEKEMVNYDIFPGGLMTMLIVEPPTVTIPYMKEACQ